MSAERIVLLHSIELDLIPLTLWLAAFLEHHIESVAKRIVPIISLSIRFQNVIDLLRIPLQRRDCLYDRGASLKDTQSACLKFVINIASRSDTILCRS